MESICQLCLKSSISEYLRLLASFNIQLNLILPEIDVSVAESPVVCLICIKMLEESYTFKTMCLETNAHIKTFLEKHGNLDLPELSEMLHRKSNGGLDMNNLPMHSAKDDIEVVIVKCDNVQDNLNYDVLDNVDNDDIDGSISCSFTDEIDPLTPNDEENFKKEEQNCKTYSKKIMDQDHFDKSRCCTFKEEPEDSLSLSKHRVKYNIENCNIDMDGFLEIEEEAIQNKNMKNFQEESEKCINCNRENCECKVNNLINKNTENLQKATSKSSNCVLDERDKALAKKSINCGYCSKEYANEPDLQIHVRAYHANLIESVVCGTCGMHFKKLSDYEMHACQLGSCLLICDICNKFFPSPCILQRHKQTHEAYTKFMCSICKKGFSSKFHLQKHINKVHYDKRDLIKYVCIHCCCDFTSRKDLFKHKLESHPNKVKTRCTCDICGVTLRAKSQLKIHMLVHSGEKPHRCEVCGKAFSQRSTLNTHIQSCHSQEKNFACSLCDKKFSIKSILFKHMENIHMADKIEKNVKCTDCGKAFRVQSQLTYHLRRHANERKYVCKICNKAFIDSSALRKHNYIHFEKRIVCEICGKGFHQHSNLRIHKKVHNK